MREWEGAPKAELHVHLWGAIPPELLIQLGRRHGVRLPADTPQGLSDWFRFRDFDHFQEVMNAAGSCLRTVEDVELLVSAVRHLGAERIAHGVRAIEDPALVAYLAEHRIALDVCPTSNLRLGVYSSMAAHPLRRLIEAGVPVTINTDDPTMFGVTLNDEVASLSAEHGLDGDAVSEIVANGFRFGFESSAAV